MKKTSRIYMAPMAGVTDRAFREIIEDYGVDYCYTEMISAKGLYYNDESTKRILDTKGEKNLGVQVFGSDPEIIGEVCQKYLCDGRFTSIDLNLGCPAPKIFKNGDGSALLANPDLIYTIVKKMTEKSTLPITAKIRLGVDASSKNYIKVAQTLEKAGAVSITVHGRTRTMYYSGEADLDAIKEVKESVKIPVIGNGDIFTYQDALKMIQYTGVDGVMLARGALGNPFIFKQIKEALSGEAVYTPSLTEKLDTINIHYKKAIEYKPKIGFKEMRKHIAWYLKAVADTNKLKNEINTTENPERVFEILENIRNR